MEFCPDCGTLLAPKKVDGKKILACPNCGSSKDAGLADNRYVLSKNAADKPQVVVVKDEVVPYPITKVLCKKCKNTEAYYYAVQTRGGDESETVYLTCTKCKHIWKMTS